MKNIFKHVIAAIDLGDEDNSAKVLYAAMEAIDPGDTLHVTTVVPDYGLSIVGSYFPPGHEQKMIEQANEALHAFTKKYLPADRQVQHVVGHGQIYEEIINAANHVGADLIVIGAARPELKDYLIGPNAARVMRHANQSVLVVRH